MRAIDVLASLESANIWSNNETVGSSVYYGVGYPLAGAGGLDEAIGAALARGAGGPRAGGGGGARAALAPVGGGGGALGGALPPELVVAD